GDVIANVADEFDHPTRVQEGSDEKISGRTCLSDRDSPVRRIEDDGPPVHRFSGILQRRITQVVPFDLLSRALSAEDVTLLIEVRCYLTRLCHVTHGDDRARTIVQCRGNCRTGAQDVDDDYGPIFYIF